MMVKRFIDPDGIYPDIYRATDADSIKDFMAVLKANMPQARIDRFREKYPDRSHIADELQRKHDYAQKTKTRDALIAVGEAIVRAETDAILATVRPRIARDNARQKGTKKGRRRDDPVTLWIESQNIEGKNSTEIFYLLPESHEADVDMPYRDKGEKRAIYFLDKKGREKSITFETLENKISQVRKNHGK